MLSVRISFCPSGEAFGAFEKTCTSFGKNMYVFSGKHFDVFFEGKSGGDRSIRLLVLSLRETKIEATKQTD